MPTATTCKLLDSPLVRRQHLLGHTPQRLPITRLHHMPLDRFSLSTEWYPSRVPASCTSRATP